MIQNTEIGVRTLEEITVEIKSLKEDFGNDWGKVREVVDGIGRTKESTRIATAKVHLKITDPAVKSINGHSFSSCQNLVSLELPHIEVIGPFAFADAYALSDVRIRPDAKIEVAANSFAYCLSLEALASACDFDTSQGKKTSSGRNNATIGITSYLHWRRQMDDNKSAFYAIMTMLQLCNTANSSSLLYWLGLGIPMRASTNDPVMSFLANAGDDITRYVLSFKFGEKRGEGDLRSLSREKLLQVALEKKVLRMENNGWGNKQFWNIAVDRQGKVVELAKAVAEGLVTMENASWIWGLSIKGEGTVVDQDGLYGDKGVVVGRIHRNLVIPL